MDLDSYFQNYLINQNGSPFIQSVLIQALKQLWDSNHDSSVAMTQLFMCAKDHFD